ncbi:nicotinate-nucleotide adenylyltransferase [Clostridium cylindrosporum]|uniref:Probable nicotinate-nucleotide adenylyltransferase n=1 Tax=Clostridium cylindrosporum DSM 605 TaxID=1121307 RepID=A0A0J8D634_CLOCY|nr:nicotinate-nucleotide adenylyltransferase [Clostridium cylindrosporum]KMT21555.1 putative nicotinate-nucleotide adenylyltransferase NadD [Clostridium cylindrosporum DSM 605]
MLRLGVLGGTFNPIHVGHLIIAQYVLEELELDRVIFIPTGNPPHKSLKSIESGTHRLNMIKKAIGYNKDFTFSDMEIKRQGITYTYDTLTEIHNTYEDVEINFIVGYDTLLDMKNWHNLQEVMILANFVVVNRNSENSVILKYLESFKLNYGGNIGILNIPNIDISSTEVRKRIAKGKNATYMVTKPVHDYIVENNLYRGDLI